MTDNTYDEAREYELKNVAEMLSVQDLEDMQALVNALTNSQQTQYVFQLTAKLSHIVYRGRDSVYWEKWKR